MIKSFKKIMLLLLLGLLFSIILSTKVEAAKVKKEKKIIEEGETYDVILFWGQSNMVGRNGGEDPYIKKGVDWRETYVYSKYPKTKSMSVSELTGIRQDILDKTKSLSYVEVDIKKGTALEYLYGKGTVRDLRELDEKNYKLGENLKYNSATEKLVPTDDAKNATLQKSSGTNMIPQFCAQYYERTGRKVVVVMCAKGGESISNFLPSDDLDYGAKENEKYIYEAMKEKYNSAIEYITEECGAIVGQRLYVVSQARKANANEISDDTAKKVEAGIEKYYKEEFDAYQRAKEKFEKIKEKYGKNTNTYKNAEKKYNDAKEIYDYKKISVEYEKIFLKVDKNLANDFGIKIGAIVTNGSNPEGYVGDYFKNKYEEVEAVYEAQMRLVEKTDILLGSNFQHENYVPRKEIYESEDYKNNKYTYENGEKMPYKQAKAIARLSLCYYHGRGEKANKNGNHFTAAALSQIGYEVANNLSKVGRVSIIKQPTKLKYHVGDTLDTKGMKIKVLYTNGITEIITKGFKCTPTKLNKVGIQEIKVSYGGKSRKFNVNVVK